MERQPEEIQFTVRNRCYHAILPTNFGSLDDFLSKTPSLGLRNTVERLRVAYGTTARMDYRQEDASSWMVFVALPYHPWVSRTGNNPLA